MKKITFTNYLNKTEFKKVINYYLDGMAKIKKVSSFNSDIAIFQLIVNDGRHLFNITDCTFQSCFINEFTGKMQATFTCDLKQLKAILNTIRFFNQDTKSKAKMNFPDVVLKSEYI